MKVTPSTLLTALFVLLQFTTNAQSSRLIGKANHVYTGSTYTLQDSTAYFYSGGRGGDLTHPLCFDSSITWLMNGSSLAIHSQIYKTYQDTSSVSGGALRLDGATTVYWDTIYLGVLGSCKYLIGYNPNYTVSSVSELTMDIFGNWINLARDNYFYTSDTSVPFMIHQTGSGSSWINSYRRFFTYNTTPTVNQQVDRQHTQGTFYETTDFDYTIRCKNDFSGSGKHLWNGVSFGTIPIDSFIYTYDGAGNLTVKKHLSMTSSGWVNDTNCVFSNFISRDVAITEIDEVWNGSSFDPKIRYTYTYNTFNQVTSKLAETWTGSAWVTGPTLSYYYYSPYTPLTETVKITNAADVTLYPNPASTSINVSIKWNEAQPFTIALYDITGKLVTMRNIAPTSQYKGSIPTGNLPNGNYVVKITGTDGVVTKEIIVAH